MVSSGGYLGVLPAAPGVSAAPGETLSAQSSLVKQIEFPHQHDRYPPFSVSPFSLKEKQNKT